MGNLFSRKKPALTEEEARQKALVKDGQPGMVYLYQFTRWKAGTPSASMPCLRVETFLRYYKINHIVVPTNQPGSNGRWPWIQFGKTTIADSQDIVQHLIQHHPALAGADPNAHLTAAQKATGLLLERTLDWHLYHAMLRSRWVDTRQLFFEQTEILLPKILKNFLLGYVRRGILRCLNEGGWGDYSSQQHHQQFAEDLKAIEDLLADPVDGDASSTGFLFGNTDPTKLTTFDLSAYAYVSNVCHMQPAALVGPPEVQRMVAPGTKLRRFADRVRDLVYPDIQAIQQRAGSSKRELFALKQKSE